MEIIQYYPSKLDIFTDSTQKDKKNKELLQLRQNYHRNN